MFKEHLAGAEYFLELFWIERQISFHNPLNLLYFVLNLFFLRFHDMFERAAPWTRLLLGRCFQGRLNNGAVRGISAERLLRWYRPAFGPQGGGFYPLIRV